jgi:hypothetical protein
MDVETKRIVILANSIRHAPCRCVAGREVVSDRPPVMFGPWVRPVSAHGDGELFEPEIKLEDGAQPAILDVVDVPLDGPRPLPHQPDNWLIQRRGQWRKVGRMSAGYLSHLEERPPHLWLDGRRSDRTAACRFVEQSPPQSLWLISPIDLRLRFWSEPIADSEGQKRRRRAVFRYGAIEYDLPLTDQRLTTRFEEQFPALHEPRLEVTLPNGDAYLLCVSLTTAYHGYHYKVVATVIEIK